MIVRICALFKAYTGGRSWKAIGDRLLKARYTSRSDHNTTTVRTAVCTAVCTAVRTAVCTADPTVVCTAVCTAVRTAVCTTVCTSVCSAVRTTVCTAVCNSVCIAVCTAVCIAVRTCCYRVKTQLQYATTTTTTTTTAIIIIIITTIIIIIIIITCYTSMSVCNIFRYKCVIFREKESPVLKKTKCFGEGVLFRSLLSVTALVAMLIVCILQGKTALILKLVFALWLQTVCIANHGRYTLLIVVL